MNWQATLQVIIGFVIVNAAGIAGIFFSAWMWPLPRGQGFAYVAHPVFALGGCLAAAFVASLFGFFYPERWFVAMAVGIILTWVVTSSIFLSA